MIGGRPSASVRGNMLSGVHAAVARCRCAMNAGERVRGRGGRRTGRADPGSAFAMQLPLFIG
eukprot:3868503-Pyramimonas_sp.AAC.1